MRRPLLDHAALRAYADEHFEQEADRFGLSEEQKEKVRGMFGRRRKSSPSLDRGRRQGARWCFVTPDLQMIEYVAGEKRKDWILFRSRKEAKRWIALKLLERAGRIFGLRRQHDAKFSLTTTTPDGLRAIVTSYVPDFVYEEVGGARIVEDSKPSGGLREDVYLLKKKWMLIEHGITILET